MMTFSFPQLDRFGTGPLVTRTTNDVTQVQLLISTFARSMSLSGGQKQRISIARAVVKPVEILIFDDSTSALDLQTEANLYKSLREARPDSTKIIIAQRIASVRQADRIIVLDNGRVAVTGSHEELLESCGIYQDIYRSLLGEEDEGIV